MNIDDERRKQVLQLVRRLDLADVAFGEDVIRPAAGKDTVGLVQGLRLTVDRELQKAEKRGMERAAKIASDVAKMLGDALSSEMLEEGQHRYLHGKACGARDVEGAIRDALPSDQRCDFAAFGVRCELVKNHPADEPHSAAPASVYAAMAMREQQELRKEPGDTRHCNYSSCDNKVAHAEHWNSSIRYFCEPHTSGGHMERCGEPCERLMSLAPKGTGG